MRILITGGLGFIGRHLQLRLLQEPETELFLLDRLSNPSAANPLSAADDAARITHIQADLRDYAAIRGALDASRADVIFHLAAVGVGDPFLEVDKAVSHNLNGTLNLLHAAFKERDSASAPQRIVITRTPGEFSAMNPYAASKAAAWQFCEMYARTKGWPIIGAAIFQAYGPGQPQGRLLPSAIQAALAGNDFPMTAGDQERDWIYIDDVAAGLLAAREVGLEPGTTIELGSGHLTSLANIVRRVFTLVGGPGRPLLGVLPSRPGEEPIQRANAIITHALTGWRAAVSLEEGLLATIEAVRSRQQRGAAPDHGEG